MWLLQGEKGELVRVVPGTKHAVGRKSGAIILSDDQSISRAHAEFYLVTDIPNSEDGIYLMDLGSKYGTFVNDGLDSSEPIVAKQAIVLKNGDVVRFGLQWSKFKAVFMPLVVAVSTLGPEETPIVKNAIIELGGELSKSVTVSCTHLVMKKILVNAKAVCALGGRKPIVTPAYMQTLQEVIKSGKGPLPEPSEFIPPLAEAVLNNSKVSFHVDPRRATLFSSLTFVAITEKQMSRVSPMVKCAGGKVVLFADCELSQDQMCSENVLLLQHSTMVREDSQCSIVPDTYSQTARYLSSKGFRCIAESDIGLSMVYCSTDSFCNPRRDSQNLLMGGSNAQMLHSSSTVLAPDTQAKESQSPVGGPSSVGRVINETVAAVPSPLSGNTSKRLREDNEDDKATRKFICREDNVKTPSTSGNNSELNRNKTNKQKISSKQTREETNAKELLNPRSTRRDSSSDMSVDGGDSAGTETLTNGVVKSVQDIFASCSSSNSSDKVEHNDLNNEEVENEKKSVKEHIFAVPEEKMGKKKPSKVLVISDDEDDDVMHSSAGKSKDIFDISGRSGGTSGNQSNRRNYKENSESFTFDDHETSKLKTKATGRLTKKSLDIFDSSTSSKTNENNDFEFPNDKQNKKKKKEADNVRKSMKSVDIFSSTSTPKSSIPKKSSSSHVDDFDFSDDDDDNTNKTKRITENKQARASRSNSSNVFGSSSSTKSKSKKDDFDFPDDDGPKRKKTCSSSIFSDIFKSSSSVQAASVKRERPSVDSEDGNDGIGIKRNLLVSVDTAMAKENINYNDVTLDNSKIKINNFICKQVKKEVTDDEQDGDCKANELYIKVEVRDHTGEEDVELRDSSVVLVKPMIQALHDLDINRPHERDTTDSSSSTLVNYKMFKKNKVNRLPQIIKLGRYVSEEETMKSVWESQPYSESESGGEFDFHETQDRKKNRQRK